MGGAAKCLGQIHQSGLLTEDEWRALPGRDEASTTRCAEAALAVFEYHHDRCRRTGALSPGGGHLSDHDSGVLLKAYGDGQSCSPGRSKRVAAFKALRGQLIASGEYQWPTPP
jgi:hypothetical protein